MFVWNFVKYVIVIVWSFHFYPQVNTQLVINVKNQGGEILQEVISSNISEDVVILEFQRPDGSLVTQLLDFKSDVQILRVLILGEEERGQNHYQVLCFVTKLMKNEFISPDAMSKLRQRNPSAVRQPEEDRGKENVQMDLSVELNKSSILSHHLPQMCDEAANATFARENDLQFWTSSKVINRDIVSLTSSVKRFSNPLPVHCNATTMWDQPCQCTLEVCIGWYPCGLKYCRGKDSTGKALNYRCGIKTCRKCRAFEYYTSQKNLCLWDE